MEHVKPFSFYEQRFMWACRYGRLDIIRQIYQKKRWSLFSVFEKAFYWAFVNWHVDVVRQLYEWKPTIVDSACFEDAFIYLCSKGHLEFVILLYEWKHTIVDLSCYDEAFRFACMNGHSNVVRQLYELKPTIDLSRFYQYRSLLSSLGIIQRNNLQRESIPEEETLECPICKDNIHGECLVTSCGHKFCVNCINRWLEENPTCPYCRQNL